MVASFVAPVTRAAEVPRVIPLPELIREALAGPEAERARARLEQAASGEREARSAFRPHVDLYGAAWRMASAPGFVTPSSVLPTPLGPVTVPSGESSFAERNAELLAVTAIQLLWDGGRARHALLAASRAREAAHPAEDVVAEAIRLWVIGAAAAGEAAARRRAAAEATVAEREALVRQVRSFLEHQQVPRQDLLAAEAALAMARHDLARARADESSARAAMEHLVGHPLPAGSLPGWPEELPALPPGGEDDLVDLALARRPLPAALSLRGEAADAAAEAARRQRRPTLWLLGEAHRLDDRWQARKNNAAVAVAVRIPLATGGAVAAREARARARSRELAAELEAARRSIREQVLRALAADRAAGEQERAAKAAEEAAAAAWEAARSRYREGLIGGRELLDAEEDLARAREMLAAARAGRSAARLAALVLVGADVPALTEEAR